MDRMWFRLRGEHPLYDREVDFDLVEPTGMDRSMHDNEICVGHGQPVDRCWATVRRAVIHHPKNPLRGLLGLLFHHLRDQAPEWLDACRRFTPAHDNAPLDIPRCQVLQRTTPGVLVLDPLRPSGSRWQAGRASQARLNTGLFISADDVILGAKWCPLPVASNKSNTRPAFSAKRGSRGK